MKRKKILKLLTIICSLFFLIILTVLLYLNLSPKIEISSANSFLMYDSDNNLFFKGSGKQEWVNLDEISDNVILATINTEDKNFYKHFGFDFIRIAKALYVNATSGKTKEGASTITQQYAKNLFLDFNKTWKRKIKEMWLTLKIESVYSKDEILEGYLNTINYGHGMYGIQNASKFYFNKTANELTLAEACMLVGIPKSPSNYSPLINYEIAKKRQVNILYMLYKNKKISEDDYNQAINEELNLYGNKEKEELNSVMYFQDAVMRELKKIKSIPDSYIETGGLKIYTTLNMDAQKTLEASIDKNLNNSDMQVSGIMMEPYTGRIIALIGGRDYNSSQYNRAYQSVRQVGSTMKPFLYYAALENGFTASTTFMSSETTFTFSNDQTYSPQNAGGNYGNKNISMAAAISYSDNIYAIKTHMFLGEDVLINIAKKLGITAQMDAVPSLPLGTASINMIEMASAYSSFANEGYKVSGYLIDKVTDLDGNILYQKNNESVQILNKSTTFILNNLLTSTYDPAFIDYNYPTGINIRAKLKHKLAVKSGTTNTDCWVIGYNKDVVTAIWTGYDDNTLLNNSEMKYSKLIWADSIEGYLKDKDDNWYTQPNNVVGVLVNPITGDLATENDINKKILYYIKGTEPTGLDN